MLNNLSWAKFLEIPLPPSLRLGRRPTVIISLSQTTYIYQKEGSIQQYFLILSHTNLVYLINRPLWCHQEQICNKKCDNLFVLLGGNFLDKLIWSRWIFKTFPGFVCPLSNYVSNMFQKGTSRTEIWSPGLFIFSPDCEFVCIKWL